MDEITSCAAGDWVEVRYTLLEPADRATNLPADTAAQPLLVWVKGFAMAPAALGDGVEVRTMTGRSVSGVLTDINPGYDHTFGRPAPELTHLGADLRARLEAYRASDASDASASAAKAGE